MDGWLCFFREPGGSGHDSMWGGPQNDKMNGGTKGDMMYGEAGQDRLCNLLSCHR